MPLFGQETGAESLVHDPDSYIRQFPEKITLRTGLVNTGNSFYFQDQEIGTRLLLEPGTENYLGFSLLFRSLELDLGFAPGFLNEAREDADPRLFNLNFRMFLGRWMYTLDFYSQNGFYFDLNGDRGFLPGMRTLKIGGTASLIFNNNFSFRAIGFQNEWQMKSAGSFIPRLLAYYSRFRIRGEGVEEVDHTYNLAAGPGYYYNWVIGRNFIFSLGNTTGLGLNIVEEPGALTGYLLFETIFRGAIGYNSEHFFTGVNMNFTYLKHNSNANVRLDDRIHFVEFYVGYRFNAPEKWIRAADRFNEKTGWED